MNRRSLLLGLGATLAAPSIVKAESLMKIAAVRQPIMLTEQTLEEVLVKSNLIQLGIIYLTPR